MALSGGSIYEVVEAMVPLYFVLTLGYDFQEIFPEGCNIINSLVANFIFPFFALQFTLNTNPYEWNYLAIAGDVIAKVLITSSLAAWAKYNKNGSYDWAITNFSLTTLTNALVMGEPLLKAMYGDRAGDLVVQLAVFQAVTWLTVDLILLVVRKTLVEMKKETVQTNSFLENASEEDASNETDDVSSSSSSTQVVATNVLETGNSADDVSSSSSSTQVVATIDLETGNSAQAVTGRLSVCSLMKVVLGKLVLNPNFYSCLIGIALALIRNSDPVKLQHEIMAGFVDIMAACVNKMAICGPTMAMFSLGAFMAKQEKFIACGTKLTLLGMALRFLAAPVAMAIGCYAVGLRGDMLRVAIIQAAVPQSVTSFVYAQEYNLHAEVLSTAVIIGMFVSLPLLVGYYALLAKISFIN